MPDFSNLSTVELCGSIIIRGFISKADRDTFLEQFNVIFGYDKAAKFPFRCGGVEIPKEHGDFTIACHLNVSPKITHKNVDEKIKLLHLENEKIKLLQFFEALSESGFNKDTRFDNVMLKIVEKEEVTKSIKEAKKLFKESIYNGNAKITAKKAKGEKSETHSWVVVDCRYKKEESNSQASGLHGVETKITKFSQV